MIAKPVGWTMGSSPSHLDPVESDIISLGPDEVLVRIDGREARHADVDKNSCGEDATPASQDVCHGVRGRVIEAGANALWYVDRSVIIPVGGRCENCDASQRDRAMARSDEEITDNEDDGTPAKFVVVRAPELCVASVTIDWQKPVSA
jgi:D-arabinose 1-dehydrogenase-like Zn-dependent alcohol dehydrogenase